jgi:lysylphosphatidylglycerol synthetase-like protein (DUF2156 family)
MATPAGRDERVADSRCLEQFRRFGEHSSGFLAFNEQMLRRPSARCDGFVAYRPVGRQLVQLGGAVAPVADRAEVVDEFLAWARAQHRRVTAVQLRAEDVALYADRGFRVNQLGSAYSIDLERFALRGTAFMKLRNKISRARRAGITVTELRDGDDAPELAEIDRAWLRGKGRLVQQLGFLVGERGGLGAPLRRIFRASLDGRPLAYITYAPVLGTDRPGWLYDLTRRRPEAPPGTIELLFLTALEAVRGAGDRWVHLGLTPFVGLDAPHPAPWAQSRALAAVFRQLAVRGQAVYPAATQVAFKRKWAPTVVEPEYIAFQDGPSLGAVLGLMRLTKSIPW